MATVASLMYELPHELPKDLRLRKKGNIRKILNWAETEPSAQSPLHKLNFGSSSQKTRKSRYQNFLALSSFTGFIYPVPNTLLRIVGWECNWETHKNSFAYSNQDSAISLTQGNSKIFHITSKYFRNFNNTQTARKVV